MAQGFRRLKSVRKSYEAQGEIFFLCRRYHAQKAEVKAHIRDCARAAGGGESAYEKAIFRFMTSPDSFHTVCDKYAIAASTLDRLRRKFYEIY